jgi:hypothetical protein
MCACKVAVASAVRWLWVAMGEYTDLDIYDVLDEVRCLHTFCAVKTCLPSALHFSTAEHRGQRCMVAIGDHGARTQTWTCKLT